MGSQPGTAENCLFCRILAGKEPAAFVFEDKISVAFLDFRPVFLGHCLLVPRKHFETLADLPKSLIGPLFTNARLLAQAVQQAMGGDGSLVLLNNRVSQSVPHVHIHVIPRRFKDGLRGFLWPRQKYPDEATMLRIRDDIQATCRELRKAP